MFERGYLSAAEPGFILVAGSEVILPLFENLCSQRLKNRFASLAIGKDCEYKRA
jgi:hypothetical protein